MQPGGCAAMPDPTLSSLSDFAARLQRLEAVKTRLLNDPGPGLDVLISALEEVSTVCDTIDAEITRYLRLMFDPQVASPGFQQERDVLLTFEGNQLRARMKEAKGNCTKIQNSYEVYLRDWFRQALAPQDAADMEQLFLTLWGADTDMFHDIDVAAIWLAAQARTTLDLLDDGKPDEASRSIRAARKAIQPTRDALATARAQMADLKNTFISVSKIT
jgi:hypothetical protein